MCIDYVVSKILPELSANELFHVWFSYATKAYHQVSLLFSVIISTVQRICLLQPLISACIKALAWHFEEIIISEEWEKEWLSLDRDQIIELLKSNDLVLPSISSSTAN